MEIVIEFAKLLIPAAVVLYAMYLTVVAFINKERDEKILAIKSRSSESVTPIRLQAYERMALFLERISPKNLILRLSDPSLTSAQFQHVMVREIRDEYNHNLSQQVYMSDDSWELIKNAMEEVIAIINNAASELDPEAKSVELNKKIMNHLIEKDLDPVNYSLKFIKDEVRSLF
jgi:hypothetical protein